MNNCKGFSMMEVITSLVVLMTFSLILIPTLLLVYNERMAIQQEKRAIYLIDKAITSWIYENTISNKEVADLDTTYNIVLTVDEASQQLKACISWKAANERYYERCESGKR